MAIALRSLWPSTARSRRRSAAVFVGAVEVLDRLDLGHPDLADRDRRRRCAGGHRHRQVAVTHLAEGHLVEVAVGAEDVAVPEVDERPGLGPSHHRQTRRAAARRAGRRRRVMSNGSGSSTVAGAAVDEEVLRRGALRAAGGRQRGLCQRIVRLASRPRLTQIRRRGAGVGRRASVEVEQPPDVVERTAEQLRAGRRAVRRARCDAARRARRSTRLHE